jgi:FlaA1/EpsC-like NDP-sugar epimerase
MSRTTIFRSAQVAIDVFVLSLALWLAFQVRFEWQVPQVMLQPLLFMWPYVVALQYTLLALFGIPRFSWRYIGLREAMHIGAATVLASGILMVVRVAAPLLPARRLAHYSSLPFGVIAIDLLLALVGIIGVRVFRRLSSERAEFRRLRIPDNAGVVPTLLVGAGRGGVMVAKEIAGRPELGILVVGFVDDDPLKQGSVIHGLRVFGKTADVRRIARQKGVKQAIITISNAPGSAVRAISAVCQEAGLRVKVLPGLYQLVGGEVNLTRMRDVAIEDLLGREPVVLEEDAISADLRGKVVAITGAGGSIGSEICRQVARFGPKLLVAMERSENALFEIHRELKDTFPDQAVEPCLADICDSARLSEVFSQHRPDVVFHAAAHKHVPMMEWNPAEAVKNNVFGTQGLADCAHAHGVRAFVMISTDKAINPSSVMGASKRLAELYIQGLAKISTTRFVTVRFGNVLGSNGSVVPIFKEQIARGGPVKVTHPDMKRYFMTIPEACRLVLQAGSMGKGGEIFILDMGEPLKIVDLARDLIHLSGFSEDEIEIVFTGIRPGEKLYEELSVAEENVELTRHPKIFIGRTRGGALEQIQVAMSRLADAVREQDSSGIRAAMMAVLPEYRPTVAAPIPVASTTRADSEPELSAADEARLRAV